MLADARAYTGGPLSGIGNGTMNSETVTMAVTIERNPAKLCDTGRYSVFWIQVLVLARK
jgi:hypothetical protein